MTLTIFRINTYEKSKGGPFLTGIRGEQERERFRQQLRGLVPACPASRAFEAALCLDAIWQNLNGLTAKPAKNSGSGLRHAPLRLLLGQGVNHITGSRSVFRHESFFMM